MDDSIIYYPLLSLLLLADLHIILKVQKNKKTIINSKFKFWLGFVLTLISSFSFIFLGIANSNYFISVLAMIHIIIATISQYLESKYNIL